MATEYCKKEGLKTFEKDGGLMLCDFGETFSNDSTVFIEISSEDRRPMETSKEWNDLDITENNKEMDAVEEETPPIVEPTVTSGESGSLNMDQLQLDLRTPLMESSRVSKEKDSSKEWNLQRMLSVYMQYSQAPLADKRFLPNLAHMVEPELPRDLRTIMKYPREWTALPVSGGEYYHLGVARGIHFALGEAVGETRAVGLKINTDGVQLFNNSNLQIGPICVGL